ncbi:MAG: hypothetical protein SVU69_05590 [Pseudomonadota bacterium]|nr:hypothetical protein [Pseudomonadota bacterium]
MGSTEILITVCAALAGMAVGTIISRRRHAQPTESKPDQEKPQNPSDSVFETSLEIRKQASYAIAAGNASKAMRSLERHVTDSSSGVAADDWIMLMDIYHSTGNRARFDEMAPTFGQALGVRPPEFNDWKRQQPQANNLKKDFPAFLEQVRGTKSTEESRKMIEGFIQESTRPGRPRFSVKHAEELMRLRAQLVRSESSGAYNKLDVKTATTGTGSQKTKVTETGRWRAESGKSESRAQPTKQPTLTVGTPKTEAESLSSLAVINPELLSAIEENYPRLIEKITESWPNRRTERFLDSLIIDERGGREGFPADVMAEMLFLKDILQGHNPSHRDVWDHVNR